MANMAVEKYLKTLLALLGRRNRRTHDVVSLFNLLKESFPNLNQIAVNFLHVLHKAYRLRFPDKLEIGFNLNLQQAKVLMELDRTVHEIRRGFRIERGSGRPVRSMFTELMEGNHLDLTDCNCYFGSAQRSSVLRQLNHCYEMRVVRRDQILEANYQAIVTNDGDFSSEGLRPQNGG
jgi:hypothetical protein